MAIPKLRDLTSDPPETLQELIFLWLPLCGGDNQSCCDQVRQAIRKAPGGPTIENCCLVRFGEFTDTSVQRLFAEVASSRGQVFADLLPLKISTAADYLTGPTFPEPYPMGGNAGTGDPDQDAAIDKEARSIAAVRHFWKQLFPTRSLSIPEIVDWLATQGITPGDGWKLSFADVEARLRAALSGRVLLPQRRRPPHRSRAKGTAGRSTAKKTGAPKPAEMTPKRGRPIDPLTTQRAAFAGPYR